MAVGPDAILRPWAPLQLLSGFDNRLLQLFLVGVAILLFAWGFERYRTNFSKTEFVLALFLSVGTFTLAVFPGIFERIGGLLNVGRFLAVSLISNTVFVFLVLFLSMLIWRNQASINELTRRLAIDQTPADVELEADSIAVIIPAYNEAASVGSVIEELPETVHGYAVRPIVVSDGSDDGTRERAERAGALVVEHPINQGQGGALITGFQIARKLAADVVVTMDADGQHPADHLPDLTDPVVNGDADLAIGSRYRGIDNSDNSVTRGLGIRTFTALLNVMVKLEISDCTNGFRAIKTEELERLTLTEERFSAPELIIEARKKGLAIVEVPIRVESRREGDSKKPGIGYAIGLLRTILVTWVR